MLGHIHKHRKIQSLKPDPNKSLKHTQTIPWLLLLKHLDEFGNTVSGLRGQNSFKSTKVKKCIYLELKLWQIETKNKLK